MVGHPILGGRRRRRKEKEEGRGEMKQNVLVPFRTPQKPRCYNVCNGELPCLLLNFKDKKRVGSNKQTNIRESGYICNQRTLSGQMGRKMLRNLLFVTTTNGNQNLEFVCSLPLMNKRPLSNRVVWNA